MKTRFMLFSLVLFALVVLAPRPAVAHDAGAMLVSIPTQMKIGDAVLHGQYLIVHVNEEGLGHEVPCTYVYEYKTKRLVTKFHCVHLDKTTAPAAAARVESMALGSNVREITSFQFPGSTEPIGVPGIVNGM